MLLPAAKRGQKPPYADQDGRALTATDDSDRGHRTDPTGMLGDRPTIGRVPVFMPPGAARDRTRRPTPEQEAPTMGCWLDHDLT